MTAEQKKYQDPTCAIKHLKEMEGTLKRFEGMMKMVEQFPVKRKSVRHNEKA